LSSKEYHFQQTRGSLNRPGSHLGCAVHKALGIQEIILPKIILLLIRIANGQSFCTGRRFR
jgi:hypothetical protein